MTVKKGVLHITTEDLREYLTKYQEEKKSSKVTIDNIRRILSSFFTWMEDEDYILKSPVSYTVPSFLDIGKLYCMMIEDCAEQGGEIDELMKIFSSFISDKISDFQTDVYYQNPSYLECSYQAGHLLD